MTNIVFALTSVLLILFGASILEAKNDAKSDHKRDSYRQPIAYSKKTSLDIPTHNRTIKVKVDGIVCSFCSYGVEKKLSKLPFVETKAFGGDGVLVDVESGLVSVIFKETKNINFGKMVKLITKGGYVVRQIYLNLEGTAQMKGKQVVIEDSQFPYRFILKDNFGEPWNPEALIKPINVGVFFNVPEKYKDKHDIYVNVIEE